MSNPIWALKALDEEGNVFLYRPNLADEDEVSSLVAEVLTFERSGGVSGIAIYRASGHQRPARGGGMRRLLVAAIIFQIAQVVATCIYLVVTG